MSTDGVDRLGLLRAAMERLLSDRAIHTDGRLTVTALAAEAGISRQDLYRAYRPLLEEFRGHLRRLDDAGMSPGRQAAQVEALKARLGEAEDRAARYRVERDAARRARDANASQVLYLEEQNRLLRDQLGAQAPVRPLHSDR